MAGKLSPSAQLKLNECNEFINKVARVHGLVEMYATAKSNPDQYEMPVRRAFEGLKLQLMGAGYDALSQLCGSMAMAMKRSGGQVGKARTLREGVGSLKFQLELEARSIAATDIAEQDKKRQAAES